MQASPPTTGRVKVESKQRGGIFNLLRKKKPTAKKAGKGDEGGGGGRRRRHTGEEGEEEGGGSVGDVGQKEARSFLTSSMSMPDIACEYRFLAIANIPYNLVKIFCICTHHLLHYLSC